MTVGRPTLAVLLLAAPAAAQPLNRLVANHEPEIRLDARGRNGVCDVLAFTPDGRTLLAAGEDKVVHRFAVRDDGLAPAGPPLAWNTFRERRGSVYALAVDPMHGRVAVGGFGKLEADVSVLDLAAGAVTSALPYPTDAGVRPPQAQHGVWALAFNPDGTELATGDEAGNVWAWRPGAEAVARRPVTGVAKATEGSRVVWVGYPGGRLAFARRDGGVYAADGKLLHRWGRAVGAADRVVASGDGTALAARPYRGHAGNGVEVWWPATNAGKTVVAPPGRFPDRAALDAAGRRLAVGYMDYSGPATGFRYERPGEVRVYDLTADPPTEVASTGRLPACPDQITFHPDGDRLATADRTAHDTSLWRLDGSKLVRLSEAVASDTRPVWAVGVSADGRHLSVKFDPALAPAHPNRRAAPAAPWQTFDLLGERRGWAAEPVAPVPPAEELNGWRVRFDPARGDHHWRIVEPSGGEQPLADVWDLLQDDLPRCYTFLLGPNGGTRLAVGHLWGVSVYDLRPGQQPERVRKLVGHAGYVTAIAPTHGGQGLVTAGRDQTVAFWNLAPFDHQPLLGASFSQADGKLTVDKVASGSPADELGLAPGDAVTGLMVNGVREPVPPAQWPVHLANPRPDCQLAVQVARGGGKPQWTKTKLLHRPAARFVPLRDGEWLVYTYRQCYYDSSANGDRVVQWLVAKDGPDQAPDLFPVGDFRAALRKPDKVTDLLTRLQREPARPLLVEKFPPRVELAVANPAVANNADPVEARVTVTPRPTASGVVSQVAAVELWLNDHHRVGRREVAAGPQEAGRPLPAFPFTVPNADLVSGENTLTVRVLARDGSWGTTAAPKTVTLAVKREAPRRLYGVAAGVSEYSGYRIFNSPRADERLDLANSAADAGRVLAAWAGLRGTAGYAADPADLPLLKDAAATKPAVLAHIRAAKGKVRPEDVFVVVLSGHGMRGDADGTLEGWGRKDAGTDHWYFITPNHPDRPLGPGDFKRPARVKEVCLSAQEVFEALADLPCWKVVLLDCCHSGQAANKAVAVTKNAPGAFRAGGLGPVVLAACEDGQEAVEVLHVDERGGGVFTRLVVAALGPDFPAAAGPDGRMSASDLARYVKDRVTREAEKITVDNRPHRQNAVVTPHDPVDLRRLVVAEKKSGKNPAALSGRAIDVRYMGVPSLNRYRPRPAALYRPLVFP